MIVSILLLLLISIIVYRLRLRMTIEVFEKKEGKIRMNISLKSIDYMRIYLFVIVIYKFYPLRILLLILTFVITFNDEYN